MRGGSQGGTTSIKEELRYNSEHAAKEDDGVGEPKCCF